MNKLLLSIYIPTYNRKKCVCNQLAFFCSEINGLEDKVEIVVNDNASNDGTSDGINTISKWGEFTYHSNETNIGIAGNAYKSIEYTRGNYVWIVGDDDIFESGIVIKVVQILENYKNTNFVFLNYDTIYGKSVLTTEGYSGEFGYINNVIDMINRDFYKRSIAMLFTSCIIHKRSTLEKTFILLPLDNYMDYGWSYLAALIAIKKGNGYFVKEIMLHDQNRGVSWGDVVIASRNGCYRSMSVLTKVGYSHSDVVYMKKNYIKNADTVELMIHELLTCGKMWKISLKTLLNMFLINPKIVVQNLFS